MQESQTDYDRTSDDGTGKNFTNIELAAENWQNENLVDIAKED
jgi:hypothetical protein